MALQIRRGTNVQRLLYTPLIGELVFVTDYLTAGVDPIYVGDGITLGGVAVGQNAVLSGDMEGDINLNMHDITGEGNLNFTGNINNVGNITTKKLTITGDGGIAVVSTGSITNTGNVNVSGDIISSGKVQAVTVESDLVGSVISSDSTEVLVNATTNSFSGNAITLSATGASLTVGGTALEYTNSDPFVNYEFGSESNPISFTQYEQQPNLHYGKITLDGNGDLTTPGLTNYIIYRGSLSSPENIEENDKLGGTFFRSYNGGGPGSPTLGFAGGYGFIAESQTGAATGIVPTTFILTGGSASSAAAFANNTILANANDFLKYTSKGVLKVTSLDLRELSNAERDALAPSLTNGSIIYNYEPLDASDPQNVVPVGASRLQVLINSIWYNIPVSPAG